MSTRPREFYLPFIKKQQIAKDTFSFYFDRTPVEFDFKPGQYIRMLLPHKNPDERGTSRFFTVASSPLETKHVMITTRVIQSSFKQTLSQLQQGQQVKFFGPLGTFYLRDDETSPLVLLASGIGMTPYHSMITYAAKKKLQIPLTLFVSFTKYENMIFNNELSQIASKNPHIQVIYTLQHPPAPIKSGSRKIGKNPGEWKGEIGTVSETLIRRYITDISKPIYYIVGPLSTVAQLKELVLSMGISDEQIITEDFTGY